MDYEINLDKNNLKFRQKFIELSEQIFRELGFSVPAMLHEDSLPLAMELELNGISFELLHTPGELNDRIRVMCKLGPIPQRNAVRGMEMLMHQNSINLREHSSWYGFIPENRVLILMNSRDLDGISAQGLLEDMLQMTRDLCDWEARFFDPAHNLKHDPIDGLHTFLA